MDSLYFCLALIIFGASSVYGAGRRHHHTRASEECGDRNPDNLCDLNDYDCMQNYFTSNSQCKCATGHMSDSAVFSRIAIPMPAGNTTLYARQAEVFGFKSAKIVAFYQNTSSSNLVIAFQIRNLRKTYTPATLMVQKRAQEPVFVDEYMNTRVGLTTFTAIIPCEPSLDLARAIMYADVDSQDIEIKGVKSVHHSDPAVRKSLRYLMHNLDVAVKESFSAIAGRLINYFIQKRLCDFGIHY